MSCLRRPAAVIASIAASTAYDPGLRDVFFGVKPVVDEATMATWSFMGLRELIMVLTPPSRSGRHDAEGRHGSTRALDPGEFDAGTDADLIVRCADDRAGDAQAGLLVHLDGHDRVRRDVVDAGSGRPLVEQHEHEDRAGTTQGYGADVLRPAAGTHRARWEVPPPAIVTAHGAQLVLEP